MRVRVDQTSAEQLRARALHPHLHHLQLRLLSQVLHGLPVDPLLCQHRAPGEVRVVPRDDDKVEEPERPAKRVRVVRLARVIQLLEDTLPDPIHDVREALAAVQTRLLEPDQSHARDVQIKRDPPQNTGPLNLHRDALAGVQLTLVHLTDRSRRHGNRGELGVDWLGILRSSPRRIARAHRPVVLRVQGLKRPPDLLVRVVGWERRHLIL